jgi:hypothetical protein
MFYQWRGWGYGRNTRFMFEKDKPFPWVGIHTQCFNLMKRLVEYRTNVLGLVPDDNILRVRDECSTHIPTSLGEMYEVYQSRIYMMPEIHWSRLSQCVWRVLEPNLYYFDEALYDDTGEGLFRVHQSYMTKYGHGDEDFDDRPMELFNLLEWPFGSPDVDVREYLLALSKSYNKRTLIKHNKHQQYEAPPFPIDDLLPKILSY